MKIMIGKYEATIYPEGDGYTGAISRGFDAAGRRQRVKRKARTKTAVKDKLREVVDDLEAGVIAADNYTVAEAVNDYLAHGLKGKSPETVSNYRSWPPTTCSRTSAPPSSRSSPPTSWTPGWTNAPSTCRTAPCA